MVTQAQRHYYSLIEPALQSADREIVSSFIRFPQDVMELALKYRDHLVFQRFAEGYAYLYAVARRVMTDMDQRAFVYEGCWRQLVEFDRYRIEPCLEDVELAQSEAKTLGDYSDFLLVVFNRMLKLALDFRFEQFRHFGGAVRRIGKWSGLYRWKKSKV